MNDKGLEGLLTIEQAAKLCGFTKGNMYYYLKGRDKPPHKRWNGRLYFPRAELLAWNIRRLAKPDGQKRR